MCSDRRRPFGQENRGAGVSWEPRKAHLVQYTGGGGGVGAGGPAAWPGPSRPVPSRACAGWRDLWERTEAGAGPAAQAVPSSFPRLPFGSRLKALRTLSCLGRTEKIPSMSVYGQIGLLGETETQREDVAGVSPSPGEEPRIISTLESTTKSHFPFGHGLNLLGSQQFLFPKEPSADVTLRSLAEARLCVPVCPGLPPFALFAYGISVVALIMDGCTDSVTVKIGLPFTCERGSFLQNEIPRPVRIS